jgi:YHS domain-containing protein
VTVERILGRLAGLERSGMEIDPVCGMEVDPATAEWTHEFEGTTSSFCSMGCRDTSRRTRPRTPGDRSLDVRP